MGFRVVPQGQKLLSLKLPGQYKCQPTMKAKEVRKTEGVSIQYITVYYRLLKDV